ncbi:PepSY-associated TM helix domain-containing protein [Niabella aquatica]
MKLKSLKPRMYNALFHTHTVSGIVISFALYVIFFCGAISFFMHEMYRWENPEARFESMPANQVDYDKITGAVQKNVKNFDITLQFSMEPPTRVNPFVWFRGNTKNPEGKTGRFNAYINPQTYEVVSADEPKTHMANTIYELHFFSQIPMIGVYLAGLVSFFFLFAIITGLLIHWKNIVNKFYGFTAKGKWKQIWTNSHISLGFIALPFQLIYAVTGALFCLSILLVAPGAFLMFNGDSSQILKAVSGDSGDYKFDPKAKTLENYFTLNEAYKKAKTTNPDRAVTYLSANNYTKADGTISVSTDDQVSIAASGLFVYSGKDGKLLKYKDPDKKTYRDSAFGVLFKLHFGNFGGILLKIIYFILSLITCYIIISGVLIWRTARDNSRYTDKQRRFHHRVTKVYLAITLSMFPAIALIFLANISVPMDFPGRAELVNTIFFTGWLVLTIIGLFWNNYRALNRNYILLGSILALLIPAANGIFTGDWIWKTLMTNQIYVYAVDITWLTIGIFGLLIVKKYLLKDFPKFENTTQNASDKFAEN